MEQLALTCKTLYDKDYLDNMKLVNRNKYGPIIKCDCHNHIYSNISKFQKKTFRFISEQLNNNIIYQELINNIDLLQSNHGFIKNLKNFLIKELMIYTKNDHTIWVKNTTNIIISAIIGSLKSLYYFLNTNTNFRRIKLQNFISTQIITMIGTFGDIPGILDNIIYIKCSKCWSYYNKNIFLENHLTCKSKN